MILQEEILQEEGNFIRGRLRVRYKEEKGRASRSENFIRGRKFYKRKA